MRLIGKAYIPPIAILIFAIVFKQRFADFLTSILVRPLLSSLKESSPVIDLIFIAFGLCIITSYVIKAIRKIRPSPIFFSWSIVIGFLYSWYLFPSGAWFIFTHFKTSFLSMFRLTDIILMPVNAVIIYYLMVLVMRSTRKKKVLQDATGFLTDTPIMLNGENDALGHLPQIIELKDRIFATASSQYSFAVAIIGKWGSGKTTFILTMESLLKRYKSQVIQMKFNPWAVHRVEAVSGIFFRDLALVLSEYDDALQHKLTCYSKAILKVFDGSASPMLSALIDLFDENEDLETQYNEINERILRIGRKVIIYIDDLDRLCKSPLFPTARRATN